MLYINKIYRKIIKLLLRIINWKLNPDNIAKYSVWPFDSTTVHFQINILSDIVTSKFVVWQTTILISLYCNGLIIRFVLYSGYLTVRSVYKRRNYLPIPQWIFFIVRPNVRSNNKTFFCGIETWVPLNVTIINFHYIEKKKFLKHKKKGIKWINVHSWAKHVDMVYNFCYIRYSLYNISIYVQVKKVVLYIVIRIISSKL